MITYRIHYRDGTIQDVEVKNFDDIVNFTSSTKQVVRVEMQNDNEWKFWLHTDFWKFTRDHPDARLSAWGGFVGKNDGFTPWGWTCVLDKMKYYFGLDGHLIREQAM